MMMAEVAVAVPLMLAGEQGMFHLPSPEEVRTQLISRAENEANWPFSIDSGVLTCAWSGGRKMVMFFEAKPADLDADEPFQPRGVIVTTDPMQLTIGNMAHRDLFRPSASVEERIRLIAPIVALGERLCDQPAGAHVGHGEL